MAADPDLLLEIYAFSRAREQERIDRAIKKGGLDYTQRRFLMSPLRNLQWAYAEATKAGTSAAIAAAIDVCRKAAMQDRNHPDYDPLWAL